MKHIGDTLSPWITPLSTENGSEKIFVPSAFPTLTDAVRCLLVDGSNHSPTFRDARLLSSRSSWDLSQSLVEEGVAHSDEIDEDEHHFRSVVDA